MLFELLRIKGLVRPLRQVCSRSLVRTPFPTFAALTALSAIASIPPASAAATPTAPAALFAFLRRTLAGSLALRPALLLLGARSALLGTALAALR
jgi:hypothetical protein